MSYLENEAWRGYYEETDQKKRQGLLEELLASVPDDGANALRKQLFEKRYYDPKKPGKQVDKGIWEMVLMPSYLSGFVASYGRTRQFIETSLVNLGINSDIKSDEALKSAVYWEIRNIARRFYETCQSPKYGRKFFGVKESTWEEKQVRCGRDVWLMAEIVADKFDMRREMKIFSDAVVDEFYLVSADSKEIYQDIRTKMKVPKLPLVFGK